MPYANCYYEKVTLDGERLYREESWYETISATVNERYYETAARVGLRTGLLGGA